MGEVQPASYLVISRRYRPQRFEDLIGQEALAKTLKNAVLQDRTAHAYLFTGPRGVGKTSAARLLAKALRCEAVDRNQIPCNVCASCIEINGGRSMDVIEIDAASNTGVDNIRELRESVSYAASHGSFRVYIIDEVHMLSTAAFNALLKTLEEPPPHTIFIFATTEAHKVPATILSRCQRFDFKRISKEKIVANLDEICQKEKVHVDSDALSMIAEESEGCLRDAQSLLDQAISLSGEKLTREALENIMGFVARKDFFELIRSVAAHKTGPALELTTKAFSSGADPKIFLNKLTHIYRDLNFYSATQKLNSTDIEYVELVTSTAKTLERDEIIRGLDLCLSLQGGLSATINAEIALEALVVKLSLIRPALPATRPNPSAAIPKQTIAAPRTETPIQTETETGPKLQTPNSKPPTDSAPLARFQIFLREQRPAWMPVLKSIRELSIDSKKIIALAEADFAGKRLASPDGVLVLKQCFGTELQVEVQLKSAENKNTMLPHEVAKQKLREAKEDSAVQSALKTFKGSISETKILDEEAT